MFEIKSENQHGMFHVKLHRVLTSQEIMQLAAIAANVFPNQEEKTIHIPLEPSETSQSFIGQSRLGEHPVASIKLGDYVEPDVGVRIRMLGFPDSSNRVPAIKAVREITKLPIVSSKDLVYGNVRCPILKREHAESIMDVFKALHIYAVIVDGQCKNEVEE